MSPIACHVCNRQLLPRGGAYMVLCHVAFAGCGSQGCKGKVIEGFRGLLLPQPWGNTAPIWATWDTVSVFYIPRSRALSPPQLFPLLLSCKRQQAGDYIMLPRVICVC